MPRDITLFTDGSCHNHTGTRGGYGIVMIVNNKTIQQYCGGRYDQTTSPRMEILSVIRGLEKCQVGDRVEVWNDCQYVIKCFTEGWIFRWSLTNFAGRTNADLLKLLLDEFTRLERKVKFKWLKGHAGTEMNELADQLAAQGANRKEITYDILEPKKPKKKK
jgi:ribonuclease HI